MKTSTITITSIITLLILGFVGYFFYSLDKREIYKIDSESFSFSIETSNYKFSTENNTFKRYYYEDTIELKNVLNPQEITEIEKLITKYNAFNLDSIYISGNNKTVCLPNLSTNLLISDKNKTRQYHLKSSFLHNKLSNKKDYHTLQNLISQLEVILDKNSKIKVIPKTDLEFQ